MGLVVSGSVFLTIFFFLVFLSRSYAYDIKNPPIHQYIAREATKIWVDIPTEIIRHVRRDIHSNLDLLCRANFDPRDDVIIGSGEEDREKNPILCLNPELPGKRGEFCEQNEGRNGYFEHFWNPDSPNIDGYNCSEADEGIYNQGIVIDLTNFGIPNPKNGHYDSAYRLAQDYWDNKVMPLYRSGQKAQSYYWLGRVVHLLTDLTVPAHTHLLPHDPFIGGKDWFESFFERHPERIEKYHGEDFIGQEYWVEALPNLYNFNWQEIHPNSSNLFKLFWYTTQKTQYFASKSKRTTLNAVGNDWYVNYVGETVTFFEPPLWQGEATPVANPDEVPQRIQDIADALIPHVLKAVAGLYRLFWFETHPLFSDSFNNNNKSAP